MSLGVEDGQYQQYADQLGRSSRRSSQPELRDLWLNPANDREQRMKAVDSLVPALRSRPSS